MNFYNEHDPNAAAWLRELIARGLIPAGVVDERSITDIQPHELHGYTQCHFFAGIGGCPLALRLAGWTDTEPVWTGSCPCQPFSVAGKGLGDADERHLWPVFCNLIAECRPQCVFGEQVANAIGKGWLDGVSADLEANGYACGSAVLGAHSVGAPHQRQRLFWVADACGEGPQRGERSREAGEEGVRWVSLIECGCADYGLAVSNCNGSASGLSGSQHRQEGFAGITHNRSGEVLRMDEGRWRRQPPDGSGLGDAASDDQQRHREPGTGDGRAFEAGGSGAWDNSRIIHCRDGKFRRIPVETLLFPLADGLPYKLARRGSIRPALLKGAGNAIVPQVAAEFIMAFRDSIALDKYPRSV